MRCPRREAFRNSGNCASKGRELSGTPENLLLCVGGFPEFLNRRCLQQETFISFGDAGKADILTSQSLKR